MLALCELLLEIVFLVPSREPWMVVLISPIVRRGLLGSTKTQLDAEVHHRYIYGGHVAACMNTLMEDEPEKYRTHFSEYLKRGIEADNLEELYKKVHAAICADPSPKKPQKAAPKEHEYRYSLKKLTYEERKAKLIERLNALNSAGADDDEVEDDE